MIPILQQVLIHVLLLIFMCKLNASDGLTATSNGRDFKYLNIECEIVLHSKNSLMDAS